MLRCFSEMFYDIPSLITYTKKQMLKTIQITRYTYCNVQGSFMFSCLVEFVPDEHAFPLASEMGSKSSPKIY